MAPKIVLTTDRTLMSPYRGISLASFLGCFPALEQNNNNGGGGGNGANSFWHYMTGSRSLSRLMFRNQVTPMPMPLFNFLCNPIAQAACRVTYAP